MNYIEVNGYTIDFDGSLSMQLNNPMFVDEVSHSLQANAPFTPVNCKAFGYINRADLNDNKTRELPAKIVFGSIIFTGTVTVKYSKGEFPFYFKVDGDFWSQVKDKKLHEISFEVEEFAEAKDYSDMVEYAGECNRTDIENDKAFPVVIHDGKNENFTLNFPMNPINEIIPASESIVPIIPMFYLHFIYAELFKRFGITVLENALKQNSMLKNLLLANNYLLNEFFVDKSNLDTTPIIIESIQNTENPQISVLNTITADSGFITLNVQSDKWNIDNTRIFNFTKIDEHTIQLNGENFSQYAEPFQRERYDILNITVINNGYNVWIKDVPFSYPEKNSSYWTFYTPEFTNIQSEGVWIQPINPQYHIIINDTEFKTELIETCIILYNKPLGNNKYESAFANMYGNAFHYDFKQVNPANHVPTVKVNDFITAFRKYFGVVPFVNSYSATIKLLKDIINDTDFEDISAYAGEILEIENPGTDGFKLIMKADGDDAYYKEYRKLANLSEYNVKEPVTTFAALNATAGEIKDVRLCIENNCYYECNKTFINADINWTFLCYNTLDYLNGNGEYTVDVDINTMLQQLPPNGTTPIGFYPEFGNELRSKQFKTEQELKIKLLYYNGILDYGFENLNLGFATGDLDQTNPLYPIPTFLLRWDGAKGIYENFLKDYLNWEVNVRRNAKNVTYWPAYRIANPEFWRKKRIRGVNYFATSIKFTMNFSTGNIEHNETGLARC